MSRWKKATDASINGGGVYFTPGRYKVLITKCKEKDEEGGPGWYSIIEMKVLESDNPKFKAGDEVSQVINMNWNGNMGYVNVKRFVAAALGVDPEDHPTVASLNAAIEKACVSVLEQRMTVEEICEYVFNEDPFGEAELEMDLRVVEIETGGKKARQTNPDGTKKVFGRHEWQPVAY